MRRVLDTRPSPFSITGVRIAVIGYGPDAAQQARGLREAGNDVSVGTRQAGLSWARARRDGYPTGPACSVVERAGVVVLLVPDDEQAPVYWDALERNHEPHALLVVGRALALGTRVFEPRELDVVFVAARARTCRVAVHRDVTGRALERAISYARAAFGPDITIGTTTITAEVDGELAEHEALVGSATRFLREVELATSRARCSHAPEETRLAYYERLLELVKARARRHGVRGADPREPDIALLSDALPMQGAM